MKFTVKYESDQGETNDVTYDNSAWTASLSDGSVVPYKYVEGANTIVVTLGGKDTTVTFGDASLEVGRVTSFSTSDGVKGKATVVSAT